MERSIEVETGEGVAFTYELAGLGSRFLAVFIDMAIQLTVAVAAIVVLGWIVAALPPGSPAKAGTVVQRFGVAVLLGVGIAAAFLLFFGYFIAFEWLWEGRTPGKRLLGIRVVRDGGFPLDFTSSVIRNTVRVLEAGLGFYAVSAVSTLLSERNRRLGDFAASTIVVRDRRYERTRALDVRRDEGRDDPVVRELSAAQRELICRYAERRGSLNPQARSALAGRIAGAIRPKLGASFDHLGDDDLLVHLAETALG